MQTNIAISQKTLKLVLAALFTALTCVATMIIQVPSPMNGYVHLGDGLVLISGIILGPIYGGAAAGIGSMMADILTGYAHYAPGTLVIKALAAIIAGVVYRIIIKTGISSTIKSTVSVVIAGITGGMIVTVGYFIFASLLLGKGLAAASSIPGNIVQNILGIIVAVLLIPVISIFYKQQNKA